MKFVVILGDGMADRSIEQLGGKTPLQAAVKPNMDALAKAGELGLVKTIPDGLKPGSDTANLSVLGYDPTVYYTGRSPLEAVSMGLSLKDDDRTFRCNLVTLSQKEDYENKKMLDYSSDEITTKEAHILMRHVDEYLGTDRVRFYGGISYRHCMVWRGAPKEFNLTPPHDISDKTITEYLPKGKGSDKLLKMMKRSYDLLKDHPINKAREKAGKNPANSIWLWGDGSKPALPSFYEKYGLKGSVISAVDLIKGIGICANLNSIDVEGATGTVDTNFEGKAQAAIKALRDGDEFVYVHMEAPDECGHRGEVDKKVKSIELIDSKVVGPLVEALKGEDFAMMILPDHPTPIETRTHASEPVPYIIYRSNKEGGSGLAYCEENAAKTGVFVEVGHTLIDRFLKEN